MKKEEKFWLFQARETEKKRTKGREDREENRVVWLPIHRERERRVKKCYGRIRCTVSLYDRIC